MDQQSFTTFFTDLRKELGSFLYRLLTQKQDVEDVLQDTYLKALKKLDTFDASKASLKTWVCFSMENKFIGWPTINQSYLKRKLNSIFIS